MAKTTVARTPGKGRKIVICEKKGKRGVENLFNSFWIADYILAGCKYEKTPNGIKIPNNDRNKTIIKELQEKNREEFLQLWEGDTLKRMKQVTSIASPLGAQYGPNLVDSVTILKVRADKQPIFFDGIEFNKEDYEDIILEKREERDLLVGHECVIEVGSAGIAYNDENFFDAKGGGLNICVEDFRGQQDNEIYSFWRKHFEDGVFENEEGQFSFYQDYGAEFDFSPISMGIGEKASYVLRTTKWFTDEDKIFNVLMVFYAIGTEVKVSSGNETTTETIYTPYIDIQINVYEDFEGEKERFSKWLNKEFVKEKARLEKSPCKRKVTRKKDNGQLCLELDFCDENEDEDVEVVDEKTNSTTRTSTKLKRLETIKKLLVDDIPSYSLMRPGFGAPYRDYAKLEKDEFGSFLCDEKGKNISIPKKVDGLTRVCERIDGGDKAIVKYIDANKKTIFLNGKKIS